VHLVGFIVRRNCARRIFFFLEHRDRTVVPTWRRATAVRRYSV